ncbi:MAG: hypothetical protein ACJAYU_004414 [Bradymonadia bacterium]
MLPAILASGCAENLQPTANTCPGERVALTEGEACVSSASLLGVTLDPSVSDRLESAAVLRSWPTAERWAQVDVTVLCGDLGYSQARIRGEALVCTDAGEFSAASEREILAISASSAAADAEEWLGLCEAWCVGSCDADVLAAAGECETSCAYGLAAARADLGVACAEAQADLYECEAGAACDIADGDSCREEVDAVNATCWACASDADCDTGDECESGLCTTVDPCAAVLCEVGLCVDGECQPEDPCALIDCIDGFTCEDGECLEASACASSADCSEGVCVSGVCQPEDPCATVDCSEGQVCEGGECVDLTSCATPDYASDWTVDSVDARFEMRFSTDYPAAPGAFTGDDTWGFQKRRSDETVVFEFEEGPGTPEAREEYATLPTAGELGYESRSDFDAGCGAGALYAVGGPGSFRDREGLIVFEDVSTGLFHQVLFVGFAAAQEAEVLSIARTLQLR